jgi:hypothetical protein
MVINKTNKFNTAKSMDKQRAHIDLADEPMGEYQPVNTASVDHSHVPTMSFRKYQD